MEETPIDYEVIDAALIPYGFERTRMNIFTGEQSMEYGIVYDNAYLYIVPLPMNEYCCYQYAVMIDEERQILPSPILRFDIHMDITDEAFIQDLMFYLGFQSYEDENS